MIEARGAEVYFLAALVGRLVDGFAELDALAEMLGRMPRAYSQSCRGVSLGSAPGSVGLHGRAVAAISHPARHFMGFADYPPSAVWDLGPAFARH